MILKNPKNIKASGKVSWQEHASLLAILTYGILCCYFYLERTTFLDNPFSAYKLIQEEALHISANRWPAAIIKVLPLLCIKAQLSLKSILFSFSLSYYFFHLAFFLLIRYHLQDKIYSWLLVTTLLLPVAHSFFWNNSELILGLSVMSYWLALISAEKYKSSLIVSVVMPWFHPLLILLVGFSLVLLLLERKLPAKLLISNGLTYVVMHFVKDNLFPNYYDTNKTILFKKKLSSYSLSDGTLFELISDAHHLPLIAFITFTLLLALYNRKIIIALLLLGFCLTYLFINDLGSDNSFYVFYHETNFLILFYAAALTFCIYKLWKVIPYFRLLLAICLIVSLVRITYTGRFYTQRINWYNETATINDRSIINYGEETKQFIIQDWASAFESLIITSIKSKSAALIFTNNSKKLLEEINSEKTFITGMGNHFEKDPESNYFQLEKRSYQERKLE